MSDDTEQTGLVKVLLDQEESLGELAEAAQKRDRAGFGAKLANVLAAAATSIPVVGKLAELGVQEVFANSSYGRMTQELAKLDAEDAEHARAEQVARLVAQFIGHGLVGLGQRQDAIARELIRLDGRFDEIREILQNHAAGRVTIQQETVQGGATGVRMRPESTRSVDIDQTTVTGEGTVGVEL